MGQETFPDPYSRGDLGPMPPHYNTYQDGVGTDEYPVPGSSSASYNAPPPVITPNDIVIAVMGVTGVGKSTFISHFNKAAIAGDSLVSCTANVGIHEAWIGETRCFLIDTPGFDDTTRSDTDVLREVADWLNRSYKLEIKLAGIVYLHRIGDVRMTGAAMKNLRMFRKLCGEQGLPCVVLATTMWSRVPTQKEIQREQELLSNEEFWAGMIRKGSRVFRQDAGIASATRIIQFILSKRRKFTLDIQEEMASGKSLDQTSAGQEVQAEMEKLKAKHEEELRNLREEMEEARREQDLHAQKEIEAIRAEVEKKMEEEQAKREALKVSMEELQKQRDEELQQERQKAFEQEMAHKEAMWKHQAEIESLKAKGEYEAKLIEANYMNQMKEAELQRYRNMRYDGGDDGCVIL